MRPVSVIFRAQARRQIAAAGAWWREHRGASELLGDEIARITGLLALHPYMGDEVQNARRPGLRHYYLRRVGYHLYYCVDETEGRIEIVAFWHERRRPLRV
jgi:plasmid stabilization system protein ParE